MQTFDFNKPLNIHFIGIGGISMSGLAKLLISKNFRISGSDNNKSALTEELENMGCTIYYAQVADNITDDLDIVVYTAAIKEDNPELMAAKKKNMTLLNRAQLLGQIMSNYSTAINIAGTHGKTTTSSMIAEIFLNADTDPTISLGGILDSIGGNMRIGNSNVFVTEACEYTNSFLSFNPTINVILNIEEDHMDFFKDIDDIRNSFKLFVERLPENGTLIINNEIDNIEYFSEDSDCNVITFGINDNTATYNATNISYDKFGNYSYTLVHNGNIVGNITLNVPGLHNLSNSLAAAATALNEGIDFNIVQDTLKVFTGSHRRFEVLGGFNGVTVIDDYAHHPTEITKTLTSAQKYPHKTLWCVFQPHTYTRTKAFLSEFATALANADKIVLAKIYAARETDTLGMSSEIIQKQLTDMGKEAYYFETFDEIEKFLQKNCIDGDVLITMGAGNVVDIGKNLVKNN